MPGTLDDGVLNDVINEDFKVGASVPAKVTAMMLVDAEANQRNSNQNATTQQQNMNAMQLHTLGEAWGQRSGIDVAEGQAVRSVATADLARTIQELGAAVSGLQTLMLGAVKGGQTIPPITAPGPAL